MRKLDVDTSKLRLAAVKLLRTSHGRGQQEIHYDIREYSLAIRCYTVLMYLTPTLSTAMPMQPMKAIRCCFTDGEKLASEAALKLITRDKFVSTRVEAGDMMICNCAVPHWGVNNPDQRDRHVLFHLFYPSDAPMPDTDYQRYPFGVTD
jgi:hypothetical protein